MRPKVELEKHHWDPKRKRNYYIERMELPRMPWYQRLWLRLNACYLILFGILPSVTWTNLRNEYWEDNEGWKATYRETSIFWERRKKKESNT